MPPEPRKPIEELLEASARARRAKFGPDPQMPNPMRTHLHEEIARINRSEEPTERRSWLASFWPQISLATAVAAVIMTGSVLWVRTTTKETKAPMQLAMSAPESAPKDATAALRSVDAPPAERLEKNEDAKLADVGIAAEAPAETASNLAGTAEVKSFKELARLPAAAKASAPVMARSFTEEHQAPASNLSKRFSQDVSGKIGARGDARLKQPTNILNTFDVQREGDKIRVVDEDGSTYTGKLEQITQNDRRSLAQKNQQQNFAAQSATATKPTGANESNEYVFRAAGFNSSLKKNIVFEANYVATPAENQQNTASKEGRRNEQNQSRIVGTARISGEPPVEIDAVSVPR